eukprot:207706-Prymnesium_polylepis.1
MPPVSMKPRGKLTFACQTHVGRAPSGVVRGAAQGAHRECQEPRRDEAGEQQHDVAPVGPRAARQHAHVQRDRAEECRERDEEHNDRLARLIPVSVAEAVASLHIATRGDDGEEGDEDSEEEDGSRDVASRTRRWQRLRDPVAGRRVRQQHCEHRQKHRREHARNRAQHTVEALKVAAEPTQDRRPVAVTAQHEHEEALHEAWQHPAQLRQS